MRGGLAEDDGSNAFLARRSALRYAGAKALSDVRDI
jgi:hypothetical protein